MELRGWLTTQPLVPDEDDARHHKDIALESFIRHGVRIYENQNSTTKVVYATVDTCFEKLGTKTPVVFATIEAIVPSRYFSYDIETDGGSVQLGNAKEASVVRIDSGGGPILCRESVQAMEVGVRSWGGDVVAKQVTGNTVAIDTTVGNDTDVDVSGGHVDITTIAGISVDVKSPTVAVGAVFVEERGTIECSFLRADSIRGGGSGSDSHKEGTNSMHVVLRSGGSRGVVVGGVDGRLFIDTNPGSTPSTVDLQINEGCHEVRINSGIGVVETHIAPTMSAVVGLDADTVERRNWELPVGNTAVVKTSGGGIKAVLQCVTDDTNEQEQGRAVSRLQRGGGGSASASSGVDVSIYNADKVVVKRRSWIEARQAAMMAKRRV